MDGHVYVPEDRKGGGDHASNDCSLCRVPGWHEPGISFTEGTSDGSGGAAADFSSRVDCWNPSQVDGLGGEPHIPVMCRHGPSAREGVHANYTFVQVGIGVPLPTRGDLRNLMSAAEPFAVDEGLVPVSPGQESAEVVVYDTTSTGRSASMCPWRTERQDGRLVSDADSSVPWQGSASAS
jgi:hypothetical protein